MTRRRAVLSVLVAVVVLTAVAIVGLGGGGGDDGFTAPTPIDEKAPDGLSAYYTQKLTWTDCDDDRCTWVRVPVDYEEPDGATTRLRVKVIPADGDGGRKLFVNPGGPGGSAIHFAGFLESLLSDDVRETYDVVGVDPRGVGRSTPLECLSDRRFDAFAAGDPTPDDPAEVSSLRDDYTDLGNACRKNSGALAAHVSTEEAARDMDVVRALLGTPKLDWFGASYGTQLGATYATLFPKNVGRMVLDGAVDPSLSAEESALGQATGFGRAIRSYVADCVEDADCPLGSDVDAGLDRLERLLAAADADPLPTGEKRQLTEGLAFYGIAVTLYDKSTWSVLTQALTSALKGDGDLLLRLSDAYFQRQADGSYSGNIGQVIYAVTCLDADDPSSLAEVKASIPRFEKASEVFGRALAWGALSCTDWPIPVTHPQIPIDATGSPPIVVLGTTRDPATPYEWSKSLTRQLGTAVLVTREGDGHTAYSSGNPCITEAVDDYLVDGTVPEPGTVCKER